MFIAEDYRRVSSLPFYRTINALILQGNNITEVLDTKPPPAAKYLDFSWNAQLQEIPRSFMDEASSRGIRPRLRRACITVRHWVA